MPEQQRAQWMEPYARRVEGEPTTEAGKRLLDEWADDGERVQLEPMVDAIEAEAREQEADKWRGLFDDEKYGIRKARRDIEANTEHAIRASERARIRAAVEGLPLPRDAADPTYIRGWDEASAAVLAIIDADA